MNEQEIKRLLPNTFFAFFGRFGRLLPIQLKTIPHVLSGGNVLVVSPAASGKTEAVLCPLMERLIQNRWEPLSVVYVTPTRALVNDLYERIRGPLSVLGYSVKRKTQDHPEFNPEKPSDVLITTPESLDSLCARHPYVFKTIQVLVMDEIHLYDRTYRGDQLLVLCKRIERIKKRPFQKVGLSATVSHPERLSSRYLGFDATVVEHPSSREIVYDLLPIKSGLREILQRLEEKKAFKSIFFANTRRDVEQITVFLRKTWKFPEKVWPHHGSLSKRERESTENWMLKTNRGIVVATTTLELGIDIGDIDAVVLFSAPATVSTLLQRIGRGNRRRGYIYAIGVYRSEIERITFKTLFEKAKLGWLEPYEYQPAVSVAAQQVLSYAYQRKRVGLPVKPLLEVLEPLDLSKAEIERLLEYLIETGHLKKVRGDLYFIGPAAERIAERGFIHSNIENFPSEYEVYDVDSGDRIGTLEVVAPTFVLRGRLWNTIKVVRNKVFARASESTGPGGKVFKGKGAALWPASLGIEIKKAIFPGIEDKNIPYVTTTESYFIYHFFGVLYGFLWSETLKSMGIDAQDRAGRVLQVRNTASLDSIFQIPLEQIEKTALKRWSTVRKLINLGSFFRLLPIELQELAILRALQPEGLAELLWNAEPVPVAEIPNISVSLDEI